MFGNWRTAKKETNRAVSSTKKMLSESCGTKTSAFFRNLWNSCPSRPCRNREFSAASEAVRYPTLKPMYETGSSSWISENILSGNFPSALCIRSFLLGSWSLRWRTGEGSLDIGGIVSEGNVPSGPRISAPEFLPRSSPPNFSNGLTSFQRKRHVVSLLLACMSRGT